MVAYSTISVLFIGDTEMLRVSRLTDYSCVLMSCLAAAPGEVLSAADLSVRARLELPTTSKLLKRLSRGGLVESFRGPQGGYRLARAPVSITLADIVVAMEGPIGMTECSVHAGRCSFEAHCGARSNWRRVSDIVVAALTGVTLADMVPPAASSQGQRTRPSAALTLRTD